jgi:serine/threonine protein kinase/DNA-binding beta-propeller fold protein YncE
MPQVSIGSVFAGYRIEDLAGVGGMGRVYRAIQIALNRRVALKVIAPELASEPAFRARFERESHLAASIDHPNVIPVYEAGEADGSLFIAMRWVEGTDLRSVISNEGKLDPTRAVAIAEQVAAALDAAHRGGLVHRDVKPANVMLTATHGQEHVYLTDFGLTKKASSNTALTQTGFFVGTPDYMPPEQIMGERADARSDVYALGCLLFHELTGRPPYERGHEVAKMYAQVHDPPPSVLELVPDAPAGLDAVIKRALAKAPDERFPSAGDLGRAARAALTGAAPSQPERNLATGLAAPQAPEPAATAPGAAVGDPDTAPSAPPAGPPTAPPEAAPTSASSPTAPPPDPQPTAPPQDPQPTAPPQDPQPTATPQDPQPTAPPQDPQPTAPPQDPASTPPPEAAPVTQPEAAPTTPPAGAPTTPAPSTAATPPPAPPATPAPAPPGERPRPRARRIALAAALVVGAVAGILVATGVFSGSDENGSSAAGGDDGGEGPAQPRVVETINAGNGPDGIAVEGNTVWVSNSRGNVLRRLNARSNRQIGEPVPVGANPDEVEVEDGVVWVSNTDDGTVTRLEADPEPVVTATVQVGLGPEGLSLGQQLVWVANGDSDSVSRIDRASGELLTPIGVGDKPIGVFVGEDTVWVTNSFSRSVTRIPPAEDEVQGVTRNVGKNIRNVIEGFGYAWVASAVDSGSIVRLDRDTGEIVGRPIPVGDFPKEMAFAGGFLWVVNEQSNNVMRIDPRTAKVVGSPIPVGRKPVGIAAGAGSVWVANNRSNTVTRIDPGGRREGASG